MKEYMDWMGEGDNGTVDSVRITVFVSRAMMTCGQAKTLTAKKGSEISAKTTTKR